MSNSYSLHKIVAEENFGFNPNEYSKFKFGDDIIAENYGISLAKSFIENVLLNNPINEQIVVISSPYSFIPTATFAMKNYFVFELNKWLAQNNFKVVQETKIHRTITYKEDYGELCADQRIKLIGNDKFQIDTEFIKDKTLIFLDDIKITGSHEKMILNMINGYKIKNDIHLLYFAELINKNIHPKIENYLNYSFVKSMDDLNKIINGERFTINTRIVKYLLNSAPNNFKSFIIEQKRDFLNLFYNMALGNNYHKIESYSENMNSLSNLLINKNNIQQANGN